MIKITSGETYFVDGNPLLRYTIKWVRELG